MSAPLYFLPRVTRAMLCPREKLSRAILAERGLGHWHDVDLEDLCVNGIDAAAGPGGTHGLLLSALPVESREPPRRLVYEPHDTHVKWTSHRGGEVWIGIDDLSPVTPADLARRRPIRGHWIELADGNAWHVPVLRHMPEHTTELPRDFAFGDGGFTVTIKERFRQLWEDSAETARFFFDADAPDEIDLGLVTQRILDALALNYRLGPIEQTALGLIDSTNWQAALGATVDEPKVRALVDAQKKRKAEVAAQAPAIQPSPSSGPGLTADCESTSPAAATCT